MQHTFSTIEVLSVDPGVTTGYVAATIRPDKVSVKPFQKKDSPQAFFRELKLWRPNLLICEDFEFRPASPEGLILTSAHLIGVAMLYCEEYGIELRLQNAAYAKGGFYKSIENLKKAGVYVGGEKYHHSMDAMRHFMQWFYFGPGYKYNQSPQVELKV